MLEFTDAAVGKQLAAAIEQETQRRLSNPEKQHILTKVDM
jgi:hypothetical protein